MIKNHIIDQGAYVIEGREPSSEERLTKKNIIRYDSKISYLAYRTEINSPIGNWATRALKKAFLEDPIKKRHQEFYSYFTFCHYIKCSSLNLSLS